jgi:hypothetical protein
MAAMFCPKRVRALFLDARRQGAAIMMKVWFRRRQDDGSQALLVLLFVFLPSRLEVAGVSHSGGNA